MHLRALEPRHPLTAERHRDGSPLGKVLNADPYCQRDRASQRCGGQIGSQCAKRNPHGQPLWYVVQRDCQHQENTSVPACFHALCFFYREPDMEVRQHFVY